MQQGRERELDSKFNKDRWAFTAKEQVRESVDGDVLIGDVVEQGRGSLAKDRSSP